VRGGSGAGPQAAAECAGGHSRGEGGESAAAACGGTAAQADPDGACRAPAAAPAVAAAPPQRACLARWGSGSGPDTLSCQTAGTGAQSPSCSVPHHVHCMGLPCPQHPPTKLDCLRQARPCSQACPATLVLVMLCPPAAAAAPAVPAGAEPRQGAAVRLVPAAAAAAAAEPRQGAPAAPAAVHTAPAAAQRCIPPVQAGGCAPGRQRA